MHLPATAFLLLASLFSQLPPAASLPPVRILVECQPCSGEQTAQLDSGLHDAATRLGLRLAATPEVRASRIELVVMSDDSLVSLAHSVYSPGGSLLQTGREDIEGGLPALLASTSTDSVVAGAIQAMQEAAQRARSR
jgi:hypothetical protein